MLRSSPGQKVPQRRVLSVGQELLRVSGSADDLPIAVEEDAVVADGENAGQVVGHHHEGAAETVAQVENQLIQQARADRVESGRWLIEEENRRIQRHSSCQSGPLLHPTADL